MARPDISGGAPPHVGKRTASRCPRCYDIFPCGATAAACWCQALPPLDLAPQPPDLVGQGCLCASCLRAAIRATSTTCALDSD